MPSVRTFVALIVVVVVASPAMATIHTFKFLMDGSQAGVVTSATGECAVTLDDVANLVSVSCTYSGLTSNANNAHIHRGAVGVTGPPIVQLSFDAATSGTASVTDASMTASDVAEMIAGNTYVNIHSVNHSAGEIRGQVVAQIPAVSSWGLVVIAALVLTAGTLMMRWRRAWMP